MAVREVVQYHADADKPIGKEVITDQLLPTRYHFLFQSLLVFLSRWGQALLLSPPGNLGHLLFLHSRMLIHHHTIQIATNEIADDNTYVEEEHL